jgi:hypothetical protein
MQGYFIPVYFRKVQGIIRDDLNTAYVTIQKINFALVEHCFFAKKTGE